MKRVVTYVGRRKICGFSFSRRRAFCIDIERPFFFLQVTIVVVGLNFSSRCFYLYTFGR